MILASVIVTCHAKKTEQRPNILWIVAEDLNPNMGCYGDEINKGHTPTIDKMASDGIMFKRAYATAPVCSACRSAFITGVMQTTTGVQNHRSSRYTTGEIVPEELRIKLPQYITTLPEIMKEAGYFTFNSGKDDYNFDYDRTRMYDVGNATDYVAGMNGWQGNHAEDYMTVTNHVWSSRPDKSQPWFGQVQVMGGKRDYTHVREGEALKKDAIAPPPYFPDIPSQREAWTQHYNAGRGSDAQVEMILKQLEADGELDNTIVFFFSDHGSPTSLHHKQFCYEGGMQVPLVVIGKNLSMAPGTVVNDLVSLLDVSATTLALAGIKVPKYYDGQDLFAKRYKPAEYVIGARDRCDYTIDRIRTVRSDKYRYIRNFYPERPLMQAGYRDKKPIVKDLKKAHEDGKLTPFQEQFWFGLRAEEELYDIAADPYQMNNLALDPAFKNILVEHRTVLEKWIKETDDKGQYPEDPAQLKATYDMWKDRPVFKNAKVNPEYNQFK